MARRSSEFKPEGVLPIIKRRKHKVNVFHDERDFLEYLEVLEMCKDRFKFLLYHYVLMDNHVHLIIEITDSQASLSEAMKLLNLSYAQYYKKKYKHFGHFWQDRFKSILISKDEYLLECAAYIELNPVRAGMAQKPEDYLWSSYRFYTQDSVNKLLDPQPAYEGLSNDLKIRKELYRDFVLSKESWKRESDPSVTRRYFYGNTEFTAQMEELFGVTDKFKGRGRPRKSLVPE